MRNVFGLRSICVCTASSMEARNPLKCVHFDCNWWMASQDFQFQCPESSCEAAFLKHHQLREHICSAHAPPGTKPYRCSHPGCDKSFLTNQKLRGHTRTHDGSSIDNITNLTNIDILACREEVYMCSRGLSRGPEQLACVLPYLDNSSASYAHRSPAKVPSLIL